MSIFDYRENWLKGGNRKKKQWRSPEAKKRERETYKSPTGYRHSYNNTQHRARLDADAAKLIAEVPPDNRTLTQRILGDPLPGRSALDKGRT